METKQVTMTAEEQQQFEAFKQQQAKEAAAKRRKENRETYAKLVDEEIDAALPELRSLSEQIKTVKTTVYGNFAEVLKMKAEVMGLTTDGQKSHTFTNSKGDKRITLGVNTVDGYRDTVEDGIAMVQQYIQSLAVDDNSRALEVLQAAGFTNSVIDDNKDIRVDDAIHQTIEMNSILVNAGIGVKELLIKNTSLEDYYLSVTGGAHNG